MTRVVLASASAARARLLRNAGVAFDIAPLAVDEAAIKNAHHGKRPAQIAEMLAGAKALSVSARDPEALVIGSDQVLEFDGGLVSKCETMAEARALLMRLRGKRHELISAVVLARGNAVIWRHVEQASLWMNKFSDKFLGDYLAGEGEDLLSGVGCYRIEGKGVQLFSRIEGDSFCIQGLPMLPLLAALREQGALPK